MPDITEQPDLRQRLGGRWALSWQAYVITVPLAIATLTVWARSPSEVLRWIIVGLVSMLCVGAWTYLMHRTVFRDRATTPISAPLVVTSSVVAAIIFVGVSLAFGFALGVNQSDRLVPNPVPTVIFAAGWGLAVALILESQWRFGVQRAELLEQAVQQQLLTLQELDVLDQIRQRITIEVEDELAETRTRIEERIDSLTSQIGEEATSLADELRAAAQTTVRPLSHRLEQQARRAHPAPSIFRALANIAKYQPFRPIAVSIVYVITVAPTEVSTSGWGRGLLVVAITVALIVATMSLVNITLRRWPKHHMLLFILGIAFVQLPTIALAPAKSAITGIPVTYIDILTGVIFGSMIIIGTSAFGAWNRSREEAIRQFSEEIRGEQILAMARSTAVAQAAREAAGILHGSVQSRLRACAAALDLANRSGDVVGINRALVQTRAILEQPLLPAGDRPTDKLASLVESKCQEWRGIVDTQLTIDTDSGAIMGPLASHIAEVVEEGIANAVHHGRARCIRIHITSTDQAVTLQLVDDGDGPGRGSPGLGARLMARFDADWSLTPADPGSVLQVSIPQKVSVPREPNPATP